MSRLAILLVPGSFSTPDMYDPVFSSVRSKGYEIRGLHLPTVGLESGPRDASPPTMYDDAASIAIEVEKLADDGKDVILIGHSYGGVPLTQSIKSLAKKDREAQGKKGGVVRLGYMTCLVPRLGESAVTLLSQVPDDDKVSLKTDEQGWMHHDNAPSTARIVFSDIPQEEGEALSKKFQLHSAVSFVNELTYAGYKDVPSSFLFCEADLTLPQSVQQLALDAIEESGSLVEVTRINAGHCPNISAESEVVDWIIDVANKAAV